MSKTTSKIEDAIEELEDYINKCKPVMLSSNKICVNKYDIDYLISELKKSIPEEVERFRKVISNKEAIEREAQEQANELIREAAERTNELLSESEITEQARQRADDLIETAARQAQEIYDDAVRQGNEYKDSAQQYLNDMLVNLRDMIYACIDQTTKNTNKFLEQLGQAGMTVTDNLNELNNVEAEGYDMMEEPLELEEEEEE